MLRSFKATAVLGLFSSVFSLNAVAAPVCEQIFDPEVAVKITDLDTAPSLASKKIKENFKLQLMSLFQTIENQYGPLGLKKSTTKMDWAKLKVETLKAASKLETVQEQYELLVNLLTKFNDAHISVELPSSLVYRLPVQLATSEGRYFIQHVNELFPTNVERPVPGDEVISIEGLRPDEFRQKVGIWTANGNELTNRAIFALSFQRWRESRGIPLTKMPPAGLKIVVRSAATGKDFPVFLKFDKSGTGFVVKRIGERTRTQAIKPSDFATKRSQRLSARDEIARVAPNTTFVLERFHELFRAERNFRADAMGLGDQKPFFQLPKDFRRIELPENSPLKKLLGQDEIFAGTFMRKGEQVGFIRIPSYGPESLDMNVLNLRYVMGRFKAETGVKYMVIDQTNNPGGYVIYSDLVVKALTGELSPKQHLRFAVKPSQGFLRNYLEMYDTVSLNQDGFLSKEEAAIFAQRFFQEYKKIHRAFEQGKDLSEPISMLVMTDYYQASLRAMLKQGVPMDGKTYTGDQLSMDLGVDMTTNQVFDKKTYFMINELDFSGGDATPASLQDYKRVRLIGTRTAGAGGTVEEFHFRGLSEVTVHLTTSLMVRKDGSLVENYGVQPDIQVPSKPTDSQDGYSSYFERFLQAIEADK